MQDNTEQILTNFAKNRALQDNEGQILKVRTMQDCINHAFVNFVWTLECCLVHAKRENNEITESLT